MLTFYFLSNSTPEHGKTLSRAGELLTDKANEISARLQPESSFESIIIAATLLPADWIRFKEKVARSHKDRSLRIFLILPWHDDAITDLHKLLSEIVSRAQMLLNASRLPKKEKTSIQSICDIFDQSIHELFC